MIKDVTDSLIKLGLKYELIRHLPVITTEESKQVITVENCCSCKSLYVKDKKSDNYYMAVIAAEKRADMRKLASYVGCAKFEFATEEKLFFDLCVHRGSVSPFAFLLERNKSENPIIIDCDVWNGERVKFHPTDNTATVILAVSDFKKFLEAIGKKVVVADA